MPEQSPRVARLNQPEINPELVVPVVSIRPHHLRIIHQVALQQRIMGNRRVFYVLDKGLVEHEDLVPGYRKDVLNDTPFSSFVARVLEYVELLKTLKPHDFVKLDIEKDYVCQGCATGRHCLSYNYFRTDSGSDLKDSTFSEEIAHVNKILRLLRIFNFVHGEDYFTRFTYHQVTDMQGQRLDSDMIGVEHEISFIALIVRWSALNAVYPLELGVR